MDYEAVTKAPSSGRGSSPYEKFAQMIDRHWDGIAAYCRPENKVSLGIVEVLNNGEPQVAAHP